jgi:3'-5' exoribonuclease
MIDTQIANSDIKQMLQAIMDDQELITKFKYWPAALSHHHDFRSGLLQHVMEALALVDGLEKYYPDVDFDMVRAGIVLHDIGKVEEIDASGFVPQFTVRGAVLGHVFISTEYVDRYLPSTAPDKLRWHLKHIILSHNGEREKGAPVLPATPEALLVSGIDETSANLQKGYKGIQAATDDNGMTGYNRWLNRWLWADRKLEAASEVRTDLDSSE